MASLARKRMVATAFFRDVEGRVLIVNPVYKPVWDLPGGAVEADESPNAACRREVAEELGLDRPTGRVLAVDSVPARVIGPGQTLLPDGVIIVYDGGVLSPAEVKEIVFADGELAGFEFVTADEAAGRVTPLLARRIAACLQVGDGRGRNPGERQSRHVKPFSAQPPTSAAVGGRLAGSGSLSPVRVPVAALPGACDGLKSPPRRNMTRRGVSRGGGRPGCSTVGGDRHAQPGGHQGAGGLIGRGD